MPYQAASSTHSGSDLGPPQFCTPCSVASPAPAAASSTAGPGPGAAAMRLLPTRGWTAGLFGHRDKALLVLAAATDLPYRELANMRVGQLDILDGAARITDTAGNILLIEAVPDPVLCGPCALLRWRRIIDAEVRGTSAKRMAKMLKDAYPVTAASRHVCPAPKPIRAKTELVSLFAPINQWKHLPMPIHPLSRHGISILARQIQTGLPAHRDLDVDDVVDVLRPADLDAGEPAAPGPAYDWAAANQKKKEAIAQLASLSTAMDDIEARINQLF